MKTTQLQIIKRIYPANICFELNGDLCGMDAITFKHSLLSCIDRRFLNIELDLRHMKQIDLGGLNTLAVTYRALKARGGTMNIQIHNTGPLRELLALTKMSNFLPLEELTTT